MATQKEDKIVRGSDLATIGAQINAKLAEKQDVLVSGTDIKTLNSESLLGSGNLVITDGEDGKSAYELWLDAGNTGTEADFLASLKGDTGVQIDEETFMGTIVNDVTTGGADKALSAQMGKQLNNNLTATANVVESLRSDNFTEETLDLTSLPIRSYSLQNTGSYNTTDSYKHIVVPIDPGQIVRIVGNDTNQSRYCFFSELTAPDSGKVAPLIGELNYIALEATVEAVAPATAQGLYIYLGQLTDDAYPYIPSSVKISTPVTSAVAKEIEITSDWQTPKIYTAKKYRISSTVSTITTESAILVKVKTGDTIRDVSTTSASYERVGFINQPIADGVSVTDYDILGTGTNTKTMVAPFDGFFVASATNAGLTSRTVSIKRNSVGAKIGSVDTAVSDLNTKFNNTVEKRDMSLSDYDYLNWYIASTSGKFSFSTSYTAKYIKIVAGTKLFVKGSSTNAIRYCFLKSLDNMESGATPDYATGYSAVVETTNTSTNLSVTAPSDAEYLYLYCGSSSTHTWEPQYFYVVTGRLDYMDQDIEELKAMYSPTDIIQINDPILTKNVLAQLNRPYGASGGTNYVKQATFLHFSDLHAQWDDLERIVQYYKEYRGFIGDVIHTGDTVAQGYNGTAMTGWETAGASKFMNAIGNHDASLTTDSGYPGTSKTAAECYTKFIGPYIADWGVTYEENKCYYYKDYDDSNLRLIVLDEYHYDDTQDEWLAALLEESLGDGQHVLMATHTVNGSLGNRVTTFSGEASGSGQHSDMAAMQTVQDFIDGGGHLVCWICGHAHYDNVGWSNAWPDQFRIVISCACHIGGTNYDVDRTVGTKQQDCFNIMSIDTKRGYVRVWRVGADYDRCLRHRGSFCIDYINKTVLSNN